MPPAVIPCGLRPGPVLDDPCGQPLADQPQDPFIRDPVLEEPSQPVPIKLAEEVADVRVQHPVHLLGHDPGRQRIQRPMRAAPRPEPVRETPEVHLVDGVEHPDDGPLDDLVLQRGDGRFILPSCNHVSGCSGLVRSCAGQARVRGAGDASMAGGADIARLPQRRWRGLVRRAAGLRCPDCSIRRWQSAWTGWFQGMQNRLEEPRRAVSCPVWIQW